MILQLQFETTINITLYFEASDACYTPGLAKHPNHYDEGQLPVRISSFVMGKSDGRPTSRHLSIDRPVLYR